MSFMKDLAIRRMEGSTYFDALTTIAGLACPESCCCEEDDCPDRPKINDNKEHDRFCQAVTIARNALDSTMTEVPRIYIWTEGGCIQEIFTDRPVKVSIVDFDTDGVEEEKLTETGHGEAVVDTQVFRRTLKESGFKLEQEKDVDEG